MWKLDKTTIITLSGENQIMDAPIRILRTLLLYQIVRGRHTAHDSKVRETTSKMSIHRIQWSKYQTHRSGMRTGASKLHI